MRADLAAHVRILESMPRERIRTHWSPPVGREPQQGVHRVVTDALVDRYLEMKRAGLHFAQIKRELRTSGRFMARLKKAAKAKHG